MQKQLVFLFAIGISTAYAQNYQPGKIDLSVGFGFRNTYDKNRNLDDYRTLFPNSELLKGNFNSSYPQNYYSNSFMLNVLWGIQLKQNEGFEQRLRAGFTFSGITPTYSNYFNSANFAFDTLTSSRTGSVTYVDSVFTENLFINTTQKQVGLDVAYLLRANQNGRWSFYGGVGVEVGALLQVEANISRSSYSYYSNDDGNYYSNNLWDEHRNSRQSEVHRLDGGFYGLVYLPVGLDFRFSMIKPFWRRMHLYTELRPSVGYSTSELTSQPVQLSVGYTVLGLRAEF
jgi:hypothetical protein